MGVSFSFGLFMGFLLAPAEIALSLFGFECAGRLLLRVLFNAWFDFFSSPPGECFGFARRLALVLFSLSLRQRLLGISALGFSQRFFFVHYFVCIIILCVCSYAFPFPFCSYSLQSCAFYIIGTVVIAYHNSFVVLFVHSSSPFRRVRIGGLC